MRQVNSKSVEASTLLERPFSEMEAGMLPVSKTDEI